MKKYQIILFIIFCFENSSGQTPGEWTWMSGDNIPNQQGVYGTQGVPSPANHPPALYEPCEWTDNQGNFWLYGGGPFLDDLWKYDPVSFEWTWVRGTGSGNAAAVYGTLGVSSPLNTPGSRGWGICSWVDMSGNLWLFGGTCGFELNDLWKYNISTNEWTWRGGGVAAGYYGTQGIPSPLNQPPARMEVCASWCDSQNNLWIYGGGAFGDMWRYTISTGLWTWVSGSNVLNPPSAYGTIGVGSISNTPGWRWAYSRWKDANDNLWFWGGSTNWNSTLYNDLWKYNPTTNEWTWVQGPNTADDQGIEGPFCTEDISFRPSARSESRVCWSDACGNFWLYGGFKVSGGVIVSSDLWKYNIQSNKWSLINGTTAGNFVGVYGVKGVSSPSNQPEARFGGVGWKDLNGNFWMFGGRDSLSSAGEYNDLWRYVPDTTCTCSLNPSALANADNILCPGTCTDFVNLSVNATSYFWTFSGGNPATSTDVNPASVCYNSPGSYDVQLIASNANGSDTLFLSNYITVYPFPPAQGIIQSGDTLFANPGVASYQWYFNGNIINGATDYFYVASSSGDYNVVATDTNGCEVEAVINNVIAGSSQFPVSSSQFAIFPNPVEDKFTIQNLKVTSETAFEISIYNILGEKIYTEFTPLSLGEGFGGEVYCRHLTEGIYYLEIISNNKIYRTKFLKQ